VHLTQIGDFGRAPELLRRNALEGCKDGRHGIVDPYVDRTELLFAYRAIPLQSAYCGAKFAVRGFTDSLRTELLHDGVDVHLTMVHLPAVNTPQFDWALKMERRPQPVPPIFQPEVPARAIVFAAFHNRREVWVGMPTVKTILANRVAPGLLDRLLARIGYSGQLTGEPVPADAPANLFEPVAGPMVRTAGLMRRPRESAGSFSPAATERHWSAEPYSPLRH
jgi:hypothetical protein